MAEYVNLSKYGVGYETVTGTAVDPSQGIPQEGLVTLGLGDEYANTPKFQGKPYAVDNEYVHIGKMPTVSGMVHNLSPLLLNRLLASMHGTAGSEAANVFTLNTPSDGVVYTDGTTEDYALSFKHESGASGSVNHRIAGCICSELTLTFPSAGGPVKMAYSLVGIDSSDAVGAGGTYTLETTGADAIASDFTYELGPKDSEAAFYPTGDLVIKFTPTIEVMKRGEANPRTIAVHKWGGTFSLNWPWDAAGDLNDMYEAYANGELFELKVYNDETPDAVGEYLFNVHGRLLSPPQLGGSGVIEEQAEFTMCGNISTVPYTITYFDSAIS